MHNASGMKIGYAAKGAYPKKYMDLHPSKFLEDCVRNTILIHYLDFVPSITGWISAKTLSEGRDVARGQATEASADLIDFHQVLIFLV